MIAAVAAMLESGNKVIFDDMLIDEEHAALWLPTLRATPSLVVRTRAPLEVLERREAERGQPGGLARNHIASNDLVRADLELDTDKVPVGDQVSIILHALRPKQKHPDDSL
jgi:chloramphenicol 3-O-phosphotransferase